MAKNRGQLLANSKLGIGGFSSTAQKDPNPPNNYTGQLGMDLSSADPSDETQHPE